MNSENMNFSDIGSFTITDKKNNFEIIAIEILKNAQEKITKTLSKDEIYYLNSNYKINDNTIEYVKNENIYNIDKELTINISAIVGKNGTGKSTIVEILFLAINRMAHLSKQDLDVVDKPLDGICLYYKINDIVYKIDFENNQKFHYKYLEDQYRLTINDEISNKIDISKEFFYTIAVNYSQHSLNSKYMGPWLDSLFHKNDSYQTPIVIEPFRKDGNIDVNRQDELVNSRLLVNLLEITNKEENNFRNLTEYLEAKRLNFEINTKKVQFVFDDIGFSFYGKDYIQSILSSFFEVLTLDIDTSLTLNSSINDDTVKNIALLYIFKKLINISLTYKQYKKYNEYKKEKKIYILKDQNEFFQNIIKDKSHITYKLRQAINHLKYNHIDISQSKEIDDFSIELAKIIEKNNDEKIEFLIPAPFLSVEIILESNLTKSKISFDTLSSGEKQKIYSINSIMYHLSNLNSVVESFDQDLLAYKNINIVLDEIELYFHPEMQREYISYLIKMIKLLYQNGRLENIESLNFIFVTHSPFILSDVVQESVLFLYKTSENEKSIVEKGTKTFGANIHDLLIDGFFISNSIGAYAKQQIDKIIEFYNSVDKKSEEEYISKRDKFLYIINSLGEPYLKGIFKGYIEDMDQIFDVENIDEEIEELQERLKLLEEKKSNNG